MRSPRVFQAPSGASVGAMSVVADSTPIPGLKSKANFWYIDPFSTSCERLFVTDFTSTTINLEKSLNMDHSNNAFIMCLHSGILGPWLYGAYQTTKPDRQFADDWMAGQRMLIEHIGSFCRIGGYGFYNSLIPGQPLIFQDKNCLRDGHIFFRFNEVWPANLVQTGIPNDHPIGEATQIKSAGGMCKFTANAATNEITLAVSPSPDLVVENPIILNSPYPNETFPGGLLQGYTYLIKTWDPVLRKLTLARTDTPSTTVDITSNGGSPSAGRASFNFLVPLDIRLDKINAEGAPSAGLNAVQLCLNEKGYTRDMRVEASTVSIGGKHSKHQNQTLQSRNPGRPALWFWGEDHWSSYFNTNDANAEADGLRYGPGKGLRIKVIHQEATVNGIQVLENAYGLRVDQHFRSRQPTSNRPAIQDLLGDGRSSWDIGRVVSGTGLVNVNYIEGADNDGQLITGDGNLNPLIPNLFYCDQRFVSPRTFKDDQGHAQIPDRFGIVVDLQTYPTFKFGIGYRAGVITRGTGTVILPNPAKFPDWEAVFYRSGSGTTDFKDHLGNTLAAGVGAGLKRFRWVDKIPYATDNWIIT